VTFHDVYRLYGADDQLLYVGVTWSFGSERIRKHSYRPPTGKSWWPEVDYCAIEEFPSYRDALDAEMGAIRSERPVYNIRGAARPHPTVDGGGR
jgi:hypothetical protein